MNSYLISLKEHLNEADTESIITMLNDNKEEFANNLFELISNITVHLNEDVKKEKPALFNCCDKLLDVVITNFEPEEILLQLIDDIAKASDDTAFVTLLSPLQKILIKLPETRLNSLGWGLNSVNSYLNNITLPDNQSENNVNHNEFNKRILFLYGKILPFYSLLVEELKIKNCVLKEKKIILLKFILQLLGKPLAFIKLQDKSKGREYAETIIQLIFAIQSDIFWISELRNLNAVYDIGCIDDLSLATLYYLVIAEEICLTKIPRIYNPIYIFQNILPLTTVLFSYENQSVNYNGLCLSKVLLNSVKGCVLSYELLDSPHHRDFCKSLIGLIIYNQSKENRQLGVQILQKYLFHFDTKGRFLLVYNLTKTFSHSGIISYIISQYKDMIMLEMNKSESLSSYFKGQNLFMLLAQFCYLPRGEESDILELADQIVASLNLIRFLIIRDRTNKTQVWDYFKILENRYFEPLNKAIMISTLYYEGSIKEINNEKIKKDVDGTEMHVTVAGQKLNEIPKHEQLNMAQFALTSFDVIKSLLCRINELIEVGPVC